MAVRARAAMLRGRPRVAMSSCNVLRVDGSAKPSMRSRPEMALERGDDLLRGGVIFATDFEPVAVFDQRFLQRGDGIRRDRPVKTSGQNP